MISVEINFRSGGSPFIGDFPPVQIRYAFFSPPEMTSLGPDVAGVYPLSEQLVAPKVVEFADKGFGRAALTFPDGVGCHAVMTLDAKGKPSDAHVTDCDKPNVEKLAMESLMKSKYKPATLNGKSVPVRATIHLVYDGGGTPRELKAIN